MCEVKCPHYRCGHFGPKIMIRCPTNFSRSASVHFRRDRVTLNGLVDSEMYAWCEETEAGKEVGQWR
jgi:hypothetical protein